MFYKLYLLISRTALSVENILQHKGVIPATIGIIDGKLIVGNEFYNFS